MPLRFISLLSLLFSIQASATELIQRHDPATQLPRVFREVLAGYPRSIIAKLDEKLWCSYNINGGELTNVWTPREDGAAIIIQGITSDGTHGDEAGSDGVFPQILGKRLFKKSQESSLLHVNGKPTSVELHESRFVNDGLTLNWRYRRDDQSFGIFVETVTFDPTDSALVRRFRKPKTNPDLLSPFPDRVKMENLPLQPVALSYPLFRKRGRNDDLGRPAPLRKQEKGGFRKRLNNLHPGYDSLDLTPLFGDHAVRVGGLDFLANGDLLVAAWEPRGSVYRITNPTAENLEEMEISLFAEGLHAPLGLLEHNGRVYVAEKHQLSELIDHDGDGFAESHRNICSSWGAGMNFHQFTFGPVAMDGKLLLTLSVNVLRGGATGKNIEKDRGCVIAVDPKTHDYEVVAAGLRTPNGIGHGPFGSLLVLDNQGDYKPANPILSIKPGAFYHHKYHPPHPFSSRSPTWPAIWLPQNIYGNSLSDPLLLEDGIFKGQILFGDVRYGGLKRAFFENMNGHLQGGAVRFSGGLRGGTNRIRRAKNGDLFVGIIGSGGNWGRDAKIGLQRLRENQTRTFEVHKTELRKNGFLISFTEPLKEGMGWSPQDYAGRSYWFTPTTKYGGSPQNKQPLSPISASVSPDRRAVFLELDEIKPLRHFQIHLPAGLRSDNNHPLWSGDIHYTVVNTSDKVGAPRKPPPHFVSLRSPIKKKEDPMHAVYQALCMGCHSLD